MSQLRIKERPRCRPRCKRLRMQGKDKLACATCGRFYGYIRDAKVLEHVSRMIRQHGHYDPETMRT